MSQPFHVMTKPAGAACNLACEYCYYLEKSALYPEGGRCRMDDALLRDFVRQYIEAHPGPSVEFAWQGGEPTLMGLPFFQRVIELQREYAGDKQVSNALQTNGTLLDESWAAFLKEHGFLVGISIDGPPDLHDHYRVDRGGRPTSDKVLRGIGYLKEAGVDFNTLTVVNRRNSRQPLRVYRYLKEIGSGFIQFIPIVERHPDYNEGETAGLDLSAPPGPGGDSHTAPVTEWSVRPRDYGRFLIEIFDEWVRHDVGKVFVQHFDVALGSWAGMGSSLCVFAETCGRAVALEHNGDLFSCDHYVYPDYRLGNIAETPLSELMALPRQRAFGEAKKTALADACLRCPFRFACNGDCPKHRFVPTGKGKPGISYLCPGLKAFFAHVDQPMRLMSRLLRAGRPPAEIMDYYAKAG